MQAITDLIMYFQKGGLVMWPLLACSITVIAIAIERFIYYKSVDSGVVFTSRYCAAVRSGDFAVATELARKGSGQCAQMLADVAAIAGGKAEKSAFLESRAGIFMATLRDKLDYLGIIVTMSPLLGLLGTIVGMIGAFSIFNVEAGAPMAITGGIGEALIATATGLCVAILSLCAHSYFAHRKESKIMKLRDVRNRKTPPLMIIPMIDIMFFLLVFFMLSTMYMIDLKTIPVKLPQAKNAATDTTTTFAVTMKADGSIYLGDAQTDAEALALQAGLEQKKNKNFAVVIRAEKALEYGEVIKLVDKLKGAGVARFGLATDGGK